MPPGISILEMYLVGVSWGVGVTSGWYMLVEEWLEDDDLVAWLYECHKGTEHAFIRSCSDGDFGIWIELPTKKWRV